MDKTWIINKYVEDVNTRANSGLHAPSDDRSASIITKYFGRQISFRLSMEGFELCSN
jgi:hypothetical protein